MGLGPEPQPRTRAASTPAPPSHQRYPRPPRSPHTHSSQLTFSNHIKKKKSDVSFCDSSNENVYKDIRFLRSSHTSRNRMSPSVTQVARASAKTSDFSEALKA